jgi:hypothetical protein
MWKYSRIVDTVLAILVISGSLTLVAAMVVGVMNGPVA